MMRVLVPLHDGFEEIEAVTSIDILRRAGIEVVTAGFGKKHATGKTGIPVETDSLFDQEKDDANYDMLLIPGGPAVQELIKIEPLQEMVRSQLDAGKFVAAICAAPSILAKAGVLEGVPACCFPSVEEDMAGARLNKNPVTVSGKIITSRGAGTAVPFALAVVAALVGTSKSDEVAHSIIYEAV